jgi:formate hydrogenlyase subunit 3/multisubunit Na+/H+ antiporter MnhD subunit
LSSFNKKNYRREWEKLTFVDIAQAALSVLGLPISNTFVERVFSVMNLVNCKIQNRMQLKMLNSIVTIQLWLDC